MVDLPPSDRPPGPTEPAVREAFRDQAKACDDLGSPFTAWLCRELSERLTPDTAVGRRVLSWPGEASFRGDNVPLRLCGALHALALSGHRAGLARAYALPFAGPETWAEVAAALDAELEFVLRTLDGPPQTNEVARSAMIYPAFGLVAGWTGLPLELLEVGASAGLNLNCDAFRYRIGAWQGGDPASPVALAPESRGESPTGPEPVVVARAGCDLRPFALADVAAERRLLSYVWPDQPARLERMRAAIEVARRRPPQVEQADAVDWLAARLSIPAAGRARVVYSTVAWQYLDPAARAAGEQVLEDAGARASASAPLAWVRFEADGAGPGAGLTLDLWDGGVRRHFDLGRGDFHGRWIDWRAAAP